MSLNGLITSWGSTYSVERRAAGAPDSAGNWVPGATSVISIVASIQPLSGRELRALPEAQQGAELRLVLTATELRATPGGPDVVLYGGGRWEVSKVETWEHWGETHYRAYIARQDLP